MGNRLLDQRECSGSGSSKGGRIIALTVALISLLFLFPRSTEANAPMAGCQCTDFVYSQRPDIPKTMGRAKDFLYSSRINRFPYDQVPQVGDVAVILRGEFGFSARLGHVALVVDVNEAMDHFSIVGWDGLKADCKLQIFVDLPVTSNTYFIHHKEPVEFETLSLEEWRLLAEGKSPTLEGETVTCAPVELGGLLLAPECSTRISCCDTADPIAGGRQLDVEEKPFLDQLQRLNSITQ
jgi:hypothetical protein